MNSTARLGVSITPLNDMLKASLKWATEMDFELLHKAIVNRWFTEFWGEQANLAIVDELSSADVVLEYSMTGPLRGRDALRRFMTAFREAFPDLCFERDGPLTADRDIVVYRWHCTGTHTGPAFCDFNIGPLSAASGATIELAGHTAVRFEGELIAEELVWSQQRKAQMRVVTGGLII